MLYWHILQEWRQEKHYIVLVHFYTFWVSLLFICVSPSCFLCVHYVSFSSLFLSLSLTLSLALSFSCFFSLSLSCDKHRSQVSLVFMVLLKEQYIIETSSRCLTIGAVGGALNYCRKASVLLSRVVRTRCWFLSTVKCDLHLRGTADCDAKDPWVERGCCSLVVLSLVCCVCFILRISCLSALLLFSAHLPSFSPSPCVEKVIHG